MSSTSSKGMQLAWVLRNRQTLACIKQKRSEYRKDGRTRDGEGKEIFYFNQSVMVTTGRTAVAQSSRFVSFPCKSFEQKLCKEWPQGGSINTQCEASD